MIKKSLLTISLLLTLGSCGVSHIGEDSYTVKFVNVDGSVISEQHVCEGEDATLPKDPTFPYQCVKRKFVGWSGIYKNVCDNTVVFPLYVNDYGDSEIVTSFDGNSIFMGYKNDLGGLTVSYSNNYPFDDDGKVTVDGVSYRVDAIDGTFVPSVDEFIIPDTVRNVFIYLNSTYSFRVNNTNPYIKIENNFILSKDGKKATAIAKYDENNILPNGVEVIYSLSNDHWPISSLNYDSMKYVFTNPINPQTRIGVKQEITLGRNVELLRTGIYSRFYNYKVDENNTFYSSENGNLLSKNKSILKSLCFDTYFANDNHEFNSTYSVPDGVKALDEQSLLLSNSTINIPDSLETLGYNSILGNITPTININENIKLKYVDPNAFIDLEIGNNNSLLGFSAFYQKITLSRPILRGVDLTNMISTYLYSNPTYPKLQYNEKLVFLLNFLHQDNLIGYSNLLDEYKTNHPDDNDGVREINTLLHSDDVNAIKNSDYYSAFVRSHYHDYGKYYFIKAIKNSGGRVTSEAFVLRIDDSELNILNILKNISSELKTVIDNLIQL